MDRLLPSVGAVCLWLLLPWAQAHEGHDHMPVTMKKAVEIALATAQSYSLKPPPFGLPQLDQSWRALPESAALIYENGRGYYLVSVENPAQAKTLYLRILLDGRVDAANFSGDFVSSASSSSVK
jgi:hypothetical protein